MSGFNWRTDRKSVQWGPTIRLNSLRATAAGAVWAIIMLVTAGPGAGASSGTPWWSLPIILGLGYMISLPMFFLAAKIMTTFAGEAGELGVRFGTFVCGLAIALGDPLIYLLHRRQPSWVPVETFRPFNATMVIFVMNPVKATIEPA